jgi:hypothetical protein
MAEVLGVAAGILAVMSAAVKASETCLSLIHGLKDAPDMIIRIENDISASQVILKALLEQVSRRMPSLTGIKSQAVAELYICLTSTANTHYTLCQGLQARLLQGNLNWHGRFRILLRTAEFSRFQKDLARHKSNSILALSLLSW